MTNKNLEAKIGKIDDPEVKRTCNTLSKYLTEGCLEKLVDYIIKQDDKIKELEGK